MLEFFMADINSHGCAHDVLDIAEPKPLTYRFE